MSFFISDEIRKLAYNFWIDPNNSRPYGNKNDMKRVRIGPKQFTKHPIYIYMYNSRFNGRPIFFASKDFLCSFCTFKPLVLAAIMLNVVLAQSDLEFFV
jgi:hypothetical protein